MFKKFTSTLANAAHAYPFRRWRKSLYTIGLLLGLALFARQIWGSYASLQHHPFASLRPLYLVGALAFYGLGYLLQIAAWTVVMRYLGARLTLFEALQGYLLTFLPRYIPGTVWGYLSRNEWLVHHCEIGYATSSLGSILEATTLLCVAFTFTALYLVQSFWVLPVALACGSLLWANWWVAPRLAMYTSKARWQIQPRYLAFTRLWLLGHLLYFLFWLVEGVALLLVAQSLDGLHGMSLFTGTFAASFAWAIGFLVLFVPTGLGIREATLTALLVRFAQLPAEQTTNIALCSRLLLIFAELLLISPVIIKNLFALFVKKRPFVKSSS